MAVISNNEIFATSPLSGIINKKKQILLLYMFIKDVSRLIYVISFTQNNEL